ncbi:hypothetical protein QP028_08530 [Corynebacterium suedekumii]|nr:hypothetical protein QP028_08530 [Corynebacterium suedekumii]
MAVPDLPGRPGHGRTPGDHRDVARAHPHHHRTGRGARGTTLLHRRHRALVLLPVGGLVYLALPPAQDFATSGLEWGLSVCWIAVMWLLLMTWAQPARPVGRHQAGGDQDLIVYGVAAWADAVLARPPGTRPLRRSRRPPAPVRRPLLAGPRPHPRRRTADPGRVPDLPDGLLRADHPAHRRGQVRRRRPVGRRMGLSARPRRPLPPVGRPRAGARRRRRDAVATVRL